MKPSSVVRVTGVVKTVFPAKKYGFISAEDGKDLFFHTSGLRGVKFDDLIAGDQVTFLVTEGKKAGQLKAVDVQRAT